MTDIPWFNSYLFVINLKYIMLLNYDNLKHMGKSIKGKKNFTGFYKSPNPLTPCDQIMGVKGLSVP